MPPRTQAGGCCSTWSIFDLNYILQLHERQQPDADSASRHTDGSTCFEFCLAGTNDPFDDPGDFFSLQSFDSNTDDSRVYRVSGGQEGVKIRVERDDNRIASTGGFKNLFGRRVVAPNFSSGHRAATPRGA